MFDPARRSPLVLALLLLLLSAAVAPGAAQDGDTDAPWIPASADPLRSSVDRIDQARRERDPGRLRDAIVELARLLLGGIPDGGIPVSDERWVGPSVYLDDLLEVLDDDVRRQVVEDIDTVLEPRVVGSSDTAFLERLARVFPRSRYAPAAADAATALLLESGRIRAYLDRVGDTIDPAFASALHGLAAPRTPAPPALPDVLDALFQQQWSLSVNEASPWRAGVRWREPLVDGDRLYVQDADRLRCLDTAGQLLWQTDYIDNFPGQPHGGTLRPVRFRDQIVTSNPNHITAFDPQSGVILWELPVARLFPGTADEVERRTGAHTVTPPLPTASGLIVAAVRLDAGALDARLALIDARGGLVWSRPAGGAANATYLGLGSASLQVAGLGERIFLLSQRGLLSVFHLTDGAFLCSSRYDGFSRRGSRDSLRFGDRMVYSGLDARGELLVGSPVDSEHVIVWRVDDGTIVAEIPRDGARWWSWAPGNSEAPMALVGPRAVTLWTVVEGRPRWLARVPLGSGRVVATGPALRLGDDWWIPATGGLLRIAGAGRRLRPQAVPDLEFTPERLVAGAGRLIASGSRHLAILGAAGTREGDEPFRQARSELTRWDLPALSRTLERLVARRQALERAPRLALGREILDHVDTPGPGHRSLLGAITNLALDLMPRGATHAQAAYDRAVAAAASGDPDSALRVLDLALESPLESSIRVVPGLDVPLELAAQRLYQRLRELDPTLDTGALEEIPRLELERIGAGGSLSVYRELARRYPTTAAGRRAVLELARRYYQDGNRTQAQLSLRRLVLLQGDTTEAVEARLRIAEILRDQRRFAECRALLLELRDRHGDGLLVLGPGKEERVGDRASRMLEQLEGGDEPPGSRRRDTREQLVPVWRNRTELVHQRRVDVLPLARFLDDVPEELYLVVSRRTIELRDARLPAAIWVRHFPREASGPGDLLWPDMGNFREPVTLTSAGILIDDGEELFFLRRVDGRPYWRWRPPDQGADAGGRGPGILAVAASDSVAIAIDDNGRVFAIELATGVARWDIALDGPLRDPRSLELRRGHFVVALDAPTALEIRSLASGELLQRRVWDEPDALIDVPHFLDDRRLLVLSREPGVEVWDAPSGDVLWSSELPGTPEAFHEVPGIPQLVVELRRSRSGPTFVGLSDVDGRVLWRARLIRTQAGSITDVRFHEGDLYVMEEAWPHRKVTRLELAPILLRPEQAQELPAALGLERVWMTSLNWVGHGSRLRFDGDHILIEDINNCELSVISRVTGALQRPDRYRFAELFLEGRSRLFFADFLGETLVLHTKHGSMGLRVMDALENETRLWNALGAVDPLAAPEQVVLPEEAALTAYRGGRVRDACEILERLLERPSLDGPRQRRLTATLEGLAQELGEHAPLAWEVPRLPRAPTIDASLEEPWSAASAIEVRAPRYFHPMQGPRERFDAWSGWRDQSLLVFTGWSDEGFHLALDVTDDSVHPYDREAETWVGDCLLLAFDFRADGGPRPRPDDQLLTLALTVPRPQQRPPAEGEDPADGEPDEPEDADDDPEGQFQVRRKSDGSGVIYEVTIPWATFQAARDEVNIPRDGLSFGLNLVLTDDDTGRGARSYMSLSSGQMLQEETRSIWNLFAPGYFAQLSLTR